MKQTASAAKTSHPVTNHQHPQYHLRPNLATRNKLPLSDILRQFTPRRWVATTIAWVFAVAYLCLTVLLILGYNRGDFDSLGNHSIRVTVPIVGTPVRYSDRDYIRSNSTWASVPDFELVPGTSFVNTDRAHSFYDAITRTELIQYINLLEEFDEYLDNCRLIYLDDGTWVQIRLHIDTARYMLAALDSDSGSPSATPDPNAAFIYSVDLPSAVVGRDMLTQLQAKQLQYFAYTSHYPLNDCVSTLAVIYCALVVILLAAWHHFVFRKARFDAYGFLILAGDNRFPDDDPSDYL